VLRVLPRNVLHPQLDRLVGRRHDRGARLVAARDSPAEIDLEAVVGRRIVARGDHDAGVGALGADGEREDGGRARPVEEFDRATETRE
jgi:hypothetical protein